MLVIEDKPALQSPLRVGVLGGGVLARHVVDACRSGAVPDVEMLSLVTRTDHNGMREFARSRDLEWYPDVEGLLAARPDVVLEAASVDATTKYVPLLLESGVDVIMLSVGALAVEGVEDAVLRATRSGARLIIPEGAAVGLDLLRSARGRELQEVVVDVRVPARARNGVPEYSGSGELQQIFAGSAREAGQRFPRW